MDIKAKIDQIVTMRVESVLSELLGGMATGKVSKSDRYRTRDDETDAVGRSIDDPQFGVPARQSNGPAVGETVTRRKRGRGRASVVYQWRLKGRLPQMAETMELTAKAVRSAGEPIAAIDIEKATGLKKKTVESCVYHLRQMGVIKSVKVGRGK